MLEAYYDKLSADLRKSFAKPADLVSLSMSAYDPHFLFLVSLGERPIQQRVKGLLVFN